MTVFGVDHLGLLDITVVGINRWNGGAAVPG